MSEQPSSDSQNFWTILWERTKRPMIFVGVCLLAAVALYFMQKQKVNYEKIENASLIVAEAEFKTEVDNKRENDKKYKEQTDSMRIGSNDITVAEIKKIIAQNPSEEKTVEKVDIITKSVNAIRYQSYKNEDDLINGLYGVVNRYKEAQIKDLQIKLGEAKKEKNDIDEQEQAAVTEMKKLTGQTLTVNNIEDLQKQISDEAPNQPSSSVAGYQFLKRAIENIKNTDTAYKGKSYSQEDLESEIHNFAGNERKRVQDTKIRKLEEKINTTDSDYESINGYIFKTLKNKSWKQ